MAPPPRSVVILGGGTAGWMAANLLHQRWADQGTSITLIESSEIGIVGVGEGSTPQLKAFFDQLGVAEAEWMPRCNATYKAGIEFDGWSNRSGYERYFHPFPTDVDGFTQPAFFYATQARRTGRDVPAHPDAFYLPTRIARECRAPVAPNNFPFAVSYGYHFDAVLLGGLLREIATAKGVEHVDTRIGDVELGNDGDVAVLVAEDGRRFAADLFVDASGFRAAIIEGALKEPHRPFSDNLFNDRAVVVPTPRLDGEIIPCTRSTAMSAGWAWQIPLTNRIGNGYVYSSRYIDDDAAAAELREHLALAPDAEVRQLRMRCGRVKRSWVRNCLAVGLAQGFVEPLEATALHVVLMTVERFIEAWKAGDRDAFNLAIAERYEGIRDYLVCHYRTALRGDTDYWRDAAGLDCLSDSLKAIMTAWFTGADLEREVLEQGNTAYPPQSWHCMLAGYGNFPDESRMFAPGPDIVPIDMAQIERFVSGCAMNFPAHSDALARLMENQ